MWRVTCCVVCVPRLRLFVTVSIGRLMLTMKAWVRLMLRLSRFLSCILVVRLGVCLMIMVLGLGLVLCSVLLLFIVVVLILCVVSAVGRGLVLFRLYLWMGCWVRGRVYEFVCG